jgi:hypothetical protein
MFMCVVNLKSVNKLDLTWKQSFLILGSKRGARGKHSRPVCPLVSDEEKSFITLTPVANVIKLIYFL